MDKEYIVKGYYFERRLNVLKKGLYEGKLTLLSDNKIIGELNDLDHPELEKRILLGIYDNGFPNSIHFIKTSPLIKKPNYSFIYSLASENFRENFGGSYKGYWVYVESNFQGEIADLLKTPPLNEALLDFFTELSDKKSLKKARKISFDFLKQNYFNNEVLKRLDSLAGYIGHKAFLEIIDN